MFFHLLAIQGFEAYFYILKNANITKCLIYICFSISGNDFKIKVEIHAMNRFGHWIKTSLKLFWNSFDPKEPLFGHV